MGVLVLQEEHSLIIFIHMEPKFGRRLIPSGASCRSPDAVTLVGGSKVVDTVGAAEEACHGETPKHRKVLAALLAAANTGGQNCGFSS
jgi:hypothetical protein